MRRARIAFSMFFAVLTFAVSCSHPRSDDAITTDIKARMFSDPSLKSANINVAVKDRIVTLSGEVTNDDTRLAAEELAKSPTGVKSVNEQIVAVTLPAAPLNAPQKRPPPQHPSS